MTTRGGDDNGSGGISGRGSGGRGVAVGVGVAHLGGMTWAKLSPQSRTRAQPDRVGIVNTAATRITARTTTLSQPRIVPPWPTVRRTGEESSSLA
jgi:hypothetical protein